MIVRDEEELLPACLDSLHGVADEIVVVDTGSTDRTEEIARDAGARVFSVPWTDHFAAARNAALERATLQAHTQVEFLHVIPGHPPTTEEPSTT